MDLAYDVEWVLGGPGGGLNTIDESSNLQLGLNYWNGNNYETIDNAKTLQKTRLRPSPAPRSEVTTPTKMVSLRPSLHRNGDWRSIVVFHAYGLIN